ncbi:MAG: phosphotyrosine protein phosphatase [Ruminococcus sp.]|jgi:protein-tyrosine-phosphatase
MKHYNKLIFVDDDDNSRAPMAKIIMRSKFLLGPLEIESRGLVVLFPEPMNQKAEAVLISNGYSVADHTARQLTQQDIGDDVLILTMEDAQKAKIWENYESARNVHTLTEYIRLRGELSPLYGEPLKEYGKCYEILEKLLDSLVVQLNEEELLSD